MSFRSLLSACSSIFIAHTRIHTRWLELVKICQSSIQLFLSLSLSLLPIGVGAGVSVVVVVVVRGDWRSCGARRLAFDERCKTRDAASDAGRAVGRPGSGICGDHMQGGGNHPGQPWERKGTRGKPATMAVAPSMGKERGRNRARGIKARHCRPGFAAQWLHLGWLPIPKPHH